jgi:hypothetical protein
MDSSLIFNEAVKVDPAFPFRGQHLEMILYLPDGSLFRLNPELREILENGEIDDSGNSEPYDESRVWTIRAGVLMPVEREGKSATDSSVIETPRNP